MHIRQNLSTGGYDQTGTPAGELIATAVEGGVIVMNADMAASVIEGVGAFVKKYGVKGAADLAEAAASEVFHTINTPRHVDLGLNLPPKP
jgi:hypothetical protein